LKVQLHLTDQGKPVFHADKPVAREPHPPHHGIRGWLERKANRLKESWEHADHGATGKARALWDQLHRRIPHDETTLIRLRSAASIEIEHPITLSSDEARASWGAYLTRCRRRHLPWLIINALISPVSVLLAPIPGPNLLGYWFAYRAVRDLLALLGVRHAQSGQVATTYHPVEVFETIAGASPTDSGDGSWNSTTGSVAFARLSATDGRHETVEPHSVPTFSLAANRPGD
jgi:hypothetical protein